MYVTHEDETRGLDLVQNTSMTQLAEEITQALASLREKCKVMKDSKSGLGMCRTAHRWHSLTRHRRSCSR